MDNKTLIDNIAAECSMKRDEVQDLLSDFYDILARHCVEMDSLLVPGFGQFEPKKRKERLTVHPSSGKRLLVPPKLVVSFKPSAILKSKIRK